MKVIFLDFDGVINNCGKEDDYVFCPIIDRFGRKVLLPISAHNIIPIKKLLGYLLDQQIHIVLSTSWRQVVSFKEINKSFQDFFGYSSLKEFNLIIGETPEIYDFDSVVRGNEIKEFLAQHEEITDFLIIDDNFDFLKSQKKKLLLVNPAKGFSEDDFIKVKKYFSKKYFIFGKPK